MSLINTSNTSAVENVQSFPFHAGFDPINFEIMNKMDDATLLSYCVTDQRALSLCNNEVFWRNRTMANYALLTKYKEIAESWYQFYQRIYYDAYYLLRIDGREYLYTDITLAYEKLIRLLHLLENLPVSNLTFEQLLQFDFDNYEFLEGNVYRILVIFKDREIMADDEEFNTIFRLSETKEGDYFDTNLMSYPLLSRSGPLINVETRGGEDLEVISNIFLDLNTENLISLYNASTINNRIPYIIVPDSDEQDDRLGHSKYGFIMTRKDVVLALVNPALYDPKYSSEFFVFIVRDYDINNTRQIPQLITTPGTAYQLQDLATLLIEYPWS